MDAAGFNIDYTNQVSSWAPSVIALTLFSLGTYLDGWGEFDRFQDSVRALFDNQGDGFDFIIIGGGSAGGVLAHRLAESGQHKVLLLEAGGNINPFQAMPAMSLLMLRYPAIDWNHKTVPQAHACYALPNNESHWSQGKGLGGTSNLNFLIQSRGNPQDFDNWANLTGDPSWSYENLLPYFKRAEDYQGRWSESRAHSTGGALTISAPPYLGLGEVFVSAAKELGYQRQDLNGYYTEGFDTIFFPTKRGARHSVYAGYIDTASTASLSIRRFAFVKRILVNDKKRAYGVEYEHHGTAKMAVATKEIILSAGAMNSPKILQLSGIGPAEELKRLGIEPVVDLPAVGRNLQDHISTYLGPFFIDPPVTFDIERDVNPTTISQFYALGSGPLTSTGTNAMGFLASKHARQRNESSWPDTQIIFAGVSLSQRFSSELTRGFGLNPLYTLPYLAHAEGKNSFLQIVSVGRPKARGTVGLYSNNPHVPARIDPQYYNNRQDIEVMVEGIKKAVALVENSTAFRSLGGRFTNVAFPGCEHHVFRSDRYWECYARSLSLTLHHIVGTCSMGRNDTNSSSSEAVVDTELRVRGVKGLRVIDASVMPRVVSGNTLSPIVMIAEKGADMILKRWPPPTDPPPQVVVVYQTVPPPTTTTTEAVVEEEEEEEGQGAEGSGGGAGGGGEEEEEETDAARSHDS